MNYEKMWKELKKEYVTEYNDVMSDESKGVLARMASIEQDYFERSVIKKYDDGLANLLELNKKDASSN